MIADLEAACQRSRDNGRDCVRDIGGRDDEDDCEPGAGCSGQEREDQEDGGGGSGRQEVRDLVPAEGRSQRVGNEEAHSDY